ncbi:MAG: hypothetical protein VXY93_12895, partial [Pseudomonadota bacterium]|nr:hypothetical protein [Pseudomonadota bacterium]
SKPFIQGNVDSSVKLFYAANEKISTSGVGVTVYNQLDTTNVSIAGVSTFTGNIDANGDLDVDGHTNLDNLSVAGVSTFADRVTISGGKDLFMFDNGVIRLGNNSNTSDFQMFHDGGHTRLNNATGSLYINNSSTNGSIRLNPKDGESGLIVRYEGAVQAYHSNTKRIETTSTGAIVTGILTATDLDIDGHTNLDNVNVVGILTVTRSGSNTAAVFSGGGGAGTINIQDGDDGTLAMISVDGGNLKLKTSGGSYSDKLVINPAGNVSIAKDLDVDGHTNLDNVNVVGVTTHQGHVLPSADSTYDLGLTGTRWRNVYADT